MFENDIVDTSKTFDQLRNEKAEDFPELDDGTSVTWKVEYGKITKTVSSLKKTTIAGFKSQIENSKEFLDSLKKAKGEIECKVMPSVTAKKKGVISPYKGVFNSVDEAAASGSINSMYVADDAKQRSKMSREFYQDMNREIEEYQRRIAKLIQSGNSSQKILERWELKIQSLEDKKQEYERILKQDLSGIDEGFTMLRDMCDQFKLRVRSSQIFGMAA